MKKVSTIIGVCLLCITVQPICVEAYGPEEVQQAMSSLLFEIEEAAGIEHKASKAIRELNEEGKEALYDSIDNKEKFVNSAYKALERIESAKEAPVNEALQVPDRSTELLLSPSSTTPYTPNYPPTYSVAYNIAMVLGLTSSNEDRCDGVGLEIYEDILYAAEKLSDIGDAACSVAGCDPTGVGCAIVCGVVETYKLAVLTARIPIDSCNKHNEGVDAAEIEAGYENSVLTLNDLATALENQEAILENQKSSLVNQEEIIRLLNTPQGQRPDWNDKKK
jgi:hypothetical protein